MDKIDIHFENCFGINSLTATLLFESNNKVNAIYAKNGLMKTSFSKVFKKIQDGKEIEIKDLIFENSPVNSTIKIDDDYLIKGEEIFVINSFESQYESSSISSLLVNNDVKEKLETVLSLKTDLLRKLEEASGLKISKVLSGKKVFELENQILKDFNLLNSGFLQNLEAFNDFDSNDEYLENIIYTDIFDSSVLKKIQNTEFQAKILNYLSESEKIYKKYKFFKKGQFSLPKLKNINKGLKENSFFVKNNQLKLFGSKSFKDQESLEMKLKEVETKLQESNEFKAIEKSLSDAKGSKLRDILESNIVLVEDLKLSKLVNLRRKIWNSYFRKNKLILENLIENYKLLKQEIDNIDIQQTKWQEAIRIFNDRFSLPFKMEIDNINSSIIGESLPKVVFRFCSKIDKNECTDEDFVTLSRDDLESKNTLSQGEKRALYLLNIIFDIEKRKNENTKTLFIIDDIADSFDYKNKYAIIEYLNDISKNDNFYIIILSHNFDFYRTICSRLNLGREFKYHASKNENEIKLSPEHYQDNPFVAWKKNLASGREYSVSDCKKHIISLIPFIRNVIEYGVDYNINELIFENDYLLLTNILHYKRHSQTITVKHLKSIFNKYIGKDNFDLSIPEEKVVLDLIYEIAKDEILDSDDKLENKIILAIATRLYAEKYMISKISENNTHIYSWKNANGNSTEFLNCVESAKNQTRLLFDAFKQIAESSEIKIIETVNIMTPENIHLNSFMYEPILDMDILELKSLFNKVKGLTTPNLLSSIT